MMRTHFTWSVENNGKCPECGQKTVLISVPLSWDTDYNTRKANQPQEVEVSDEVTGHYCLKCQRLRSLSLNTGS
jgi:hypothetical protein